MSEPVVEEKDMHENCRYGNPPSGEPHTCPYAEDVCEDSTTLCRCCERCQEDCADSI